MIVTQIKVAINKNEMKKILIAIIFLAVCQISYTQHYSNNKTLLNLGVGLSGWGVPVYGGLDFSVSKDVTVGGEVSFRSYDENWNGYNYHHSITGLVGNVNYHFGRWLDVPSSFDFYTGLNLGFYIWSNPNDYTGNHSSGLGLGAQLGGRYYFSNKVGINLELGSGIINLGGKVGVTFKI